MASRRQCVRTAVLQKQNKDLRVHFSSIGVKLSLADFTSVPLISPHLFLEPPASPLALGKSLPASGGRDKHSWKLVKEG